MPSDPQELTCAETRPRLIGNSMSPRDIGLSVRVGVNRQDQQPDTDNLSTHARLLRLAPSCIPVCLPDMVSPLLCQCPPLSSKTQLRASLVVQWLRTPRPRQGHGFDPWSGKIPRASGPLNRCATTTEPCTASTEVRVHDLLPWQV